MKIICTQFGRFFRMSLFWGNLDVADWKIHGIFEGLYYDTLQKIKVAQGLEITDPIPRTHFRWLLSIFLSTYSQNTTNNLDPFSISCSSYPRLCSANHRAGYFSNLACDWLSIVWAYSEQEAENGRCTWVQNVGYFC